MAAIVLAATVAVSAVLPSGKGDRRAGVCAVEMRKTKRVGSREGEKVTERRKREARKEGEKEKGGRENTYERMAAAKERQSTGEKGGEETIGGKSGRPRKGGKVQSERGETVPYKTEACGEKEICIARPRDGVNRGRAGMTPAIYRGERGFLLEKTEGVE